MNKEEKTWYDKTKEEFIKNINDSYTLNLAISILEDRASLMGENLYLQQRIDKAINILKGLRLIIPIQYEIKEGIDLSLETLGGKE